MLELELAFVLSKMFPGYNEEAYLRLAKYVKEDIEISFQDWEWRFDVLKEDVNT